MRRGKPLSAAVVLGLAALASSGTLTAQGQRWQGAIEFLADADGPALQWVERNPLDIAVAIRLGGATTIPPETIMRVLRRDFDESGGCRTHFLFERGDPGIGSSVIFITRNHVWGAYALDDSRKNVAEVCAQHKFEIERGLH